MVLNLKESKNYRFYRQEVDRAIKDAGMWNDRVRLIVYTTITTETSDNQPFGWLNYTNPREPQFAAFRPNDGDPPNRSWSTQRSGGLFQQQPQFWGPDVMDPYRATTNFLLGYIFLDGRTAAGLVKVDYVNVPVHIACQMVQGSEFVDGSNYLRNIPAGMEALKYQPEASKMGNYKDPDDFYDNRIVPDLPSLDIKGKPLWHYLVATLNSADAAKGLLDQRPEVLRVGKGNDKQSVIEAIAQTRNDVSDIKTTLREIAALLPTRNPNSPPTPTASDA